MLIHPGEMKNFPPEKVCVMISGTQGEPMSALSRAAVDNHKHANIEKGDTVVLSSRIIPGNEKAIYRDDRPPVPPRGVCRLRRRLLAAGACQRTRQPGRAEAHHQPGASRSISFRFTASTGNSNCTPNWRGSMHGVGRQRDDDRERRHAGDSTSWARARRDDANVGRMCIDSSSGTDVVEDLVIKDRRHLSEDGICDAHYRHQ